ncbi:hypothetical protein [Methylobacterium aquaticum]|uniref:hypothetical protein n=1 Tax=Methylobacterium aquaticum TaxID=270351 RepID=UPI001933BE75|nr:hypothetical protein [Methylobacterium aquaticum]QRE76133.1 hypothetical protein F1D61_23490 [Methylobacterium aquaticum]
MRHFRIHTATGYIFVDAPFKNAAALKYLDEEGIGNLTSLASLEELEEACNSTIDEIVIIKLSLRIRYYVGSGLHAGGSVDVYVTDGNHNPLEPVQPGGWCILLKNWQMGFDPDGVYRGHHLSCGLDRTKWAAFEAKHLDKRFASREKAIAAAKRWVAAVRRETDLNGDGGTGLVFRLR